MERIGLGLLILLFGWSTLHAAVQDGGSGDHWAFRPVVRPEVQAKSIGQSAGRNPVDYFVERRLHAEGLSFSPEASPTVLIRRLYLVVLGVLPTPAEVDLFKADTNPGAFERLVERVLADPRHGERWGRHWLDLVRFAESNGFETNRERLNAWRFRDYVIESLNQDKPYRTFVEEQLAGDTLGSAVATGFLVGGPVDIVGSPDPALTAQQRADEIDDMVSTTGTAFLGLTIGCARCHAHKFDPIGHEEYYGMAGFFAGVKHGDRALPPTPEQQVRLQQLQSRISLLESNLAPYLSTSETASHASATPGKKRAAVNAQKNEETWPPRLARHVRFTILASSSGEPCLDELEIWAGGRNVGASTAGAAARASGTLKGFEIHKLEHVNDGKNGNSFSWISDENGKGWVQIDLPRAEPVERIVWGRDREGQFRDRIPIRYKVEVALDAQDWVQVSHSDEREPFEGKPAPPPSPVYRFDRVPEQVAGQARRWLAELETARKERDRAAKPPQAYAGNFLKPPATHRLHRGDPLQKREAIAPGTLALFSPIRLDSETPEAERRKRLAGWVANPSNPLVARVLVNRLWQHHFGIGLVDTPNDFGRNGSKPTHPELLDWLASEFVSADWSIKVIHRLILYSTTWRQAGFPRPDGIAKDAGNRLLWRFSPRRLEAEAIRDNILAVSGNLRSLGGGPGFYLHEVDRENVYHYHPKEEFGPDEMRRMIYAFKVRMEQDGIFGSFDCPDGSLAMPKRSVSTTPLQALNLYNSRFIMQQSESFATRLVSEAGPRHSLQVQFAWRLAMGREPSNSELNASVRFIEEHALPAFCRALLNSSEFMFIP